MRLGKRYGHAKPAITRQQQHRQRKKENRMRKIAVLDFETDPFDNVVQEIIFPFAACLYGDDFEIVIWEENRAKFVKKVIDAIVSLPDEYTIWAHNGGRFDFLFLIHALRGAVSFKGRGIMVARVGAHELRDSFHIIPEKLAALQKEAFDYQKLRKHKRVDYRDDIIRYMVSDCRYLLDAVRTFIAKFGFRVSIGQAAMYELRKHYKVDKFSAHWDAYIREYFFGGRVECLKGKGEWVGDYKLYDVNSMYPYVMANYEHPIGHRNTYNIRAGEPGTHTVFIKLECDNNGALIARSPEGETTARITHGVFQTTIWEYRVALKYGLIKNCRFIHCLDCIKRTTFADFILPIYEGRTRTKAHLRELKAAGLQGTPEWIETNKDDIMLKLLMNNSYGKFAQDPRRYKEHYLTNPDEMPPDDWFPKGGNKLAFLNYESDLYWIWEKPNPGFRFNNVGTAASITGASRAVLLEALQKARGAIYCDTDSIIASALPGVDLSQTALGAWDIEQEFSAVIVTGKKQYACKVNGGKETIKMRSKGTPSSELNWDKFRELLDGAVLSITNTAPTIDRFGRQRYITRQIRATAK